MRGSDDKGERQGIVAFLIGRTFLASSGHTARIKLIEKNAIKVLWNVPPKIQTSKDYAEFNQWAAGLVKAEFGIEIDVTICDKIKDEKSMLEKWRDLGERDDK
jgi:hypothetical protein